MKGIPLTEIGTRPDQLTEEIAAVLPTEPGQRMLHSRGVTVTGSFVPDPAAATLTTAEMFSGGSVPVTARLSGTRGGPSGHDADTGDQGLSVRFAPASTAPTDLIAFTLPVFFVRNGTDMLEFLTAVAPDPETGHPSGDAVAAFLERHPEASAAMSAGSGCSPRSYVGQRYYAIHAFGLTDANGHVTWARLEWHPEVELPSIENSEAHEFAPDYLSADLPDRLPARIFLFARLPSPEDPLHDPTALWSDPPQLVRLGILNLEKLTADADLDFDPLRLPVGITAPLDQLAADRSAVYLSARRRRLAQGTPTT